MKTFCIGVINHRVIFYKINKRSVFNTVKFGLPKSKKSIAKTLLLSYTAVILVCTVVISIIAVRYENIIREENVNLSQYLYSGVSKSVNWALNDIQTINAQIANDKSIQSIVKNQDDKNYWNTQSALDGISHLKNYSDNASNVDLVFIYLKMSDEIVSCHGILESDMFYNLYFENCGIDYDDWLDLLKNNKKENYINLNVNLEKERVASLAFLSPASLDRNAVSVIIMDKQKFIQNLNGIENNRSFDVYIYNSYDNLIFYEKNSQDGEIPYTVSELNNLMENDKGSVYTVSQQYGSGQWYIATAISRRELDSKILVMRMITIVSVLFAMILIIFLIRYFTKRNTEYLNKVTSILNVEPSDNEYQSLFRSVEQLLTENRTLKRDQNEKEIYMRQMVLAGILKGDTSFVEQLDKYNVQFPGVYFAVITFYLDDVKELFSEDTQMTLAERKSYFEFIVRNVFEEPFNEDISGYVTEVDGMPVCLVNLREDSEQVFAALRSIADERVGFINKNFELELSFVLSELFSGAEKIPGAYVKTLEALEYKKRMGIQDSMIYSEVPFDYSDGYLFNTEREGKLIKAIQAGNKQEAMDVVEPVLRILENNQKFSRDYVRCIVQDILSVITRTASDLPDGNSMIETGISLSQQAQNKSIAEIHEMISKHLSDVCDMVNKRDDSKSSDKTHKLIQGVIAYVEENYRDASLNITSIGDHFGMSPYYVSKLFKEKTGVALIDYINRYRIQKAKELMENSNLSGKAIAQEVGFNHVRSFYRLLKKHIGDIEE